MMHTSHRGHASETDYEQKWTPYLLEKLDKWTQFHLFWHGAFHNGTVTADDKIRRPEDLLIVRCTAVNRSHTDVAVAATGNLCR